MTYYIPDLTGSNSDYLESADLYTFTQTGVTINFTTPVYRDSIVVSIVGGSGTTLSLGVDYTFQTSDIDYTTMAKASNASATFSSVLVKSITITRSANLLPVQVSMSYQRFYLTTPSVPVSNASGSVDFTPDLVLSMLQDISVLKQQVSKVEDSAALTTALPVILDYDINETNPNNVIASETWTVDVFNHKNVIFPVQGCFFKDSVTVTINDNPLTYGTDYLILGLNFDLTRQTTNTSGIYTLIQLLYDYAGDVVITYHAVGGTVSANVVGTLYENIYEIKQYLGASQFLTEDSLKDATIIQTLSDTVKELQDKMRIQLSGSPNYGDTTNGQAVLMQVRANDTKLHWFTIASLYQVDGSTDYTKHDRMSLHIQLAQAGVLADVDIAFNQNLSENPARIEARNVVIDTGFTLFGVTNLTTVVYPQFRVVTNNDTGVISGAYIQIGLNMPSLTETITLENRSGVESTWKLTSTLGSSSTPLTPSDDGFLLPDNASTWSASGGLSVQYAQTLQNSFGYLVWGGAQTYLTLDASASTTTTLTSTLPDYFRIEDIKALEIITTDANNLILRTMVPMSAALSGSTQIGTGIIPIASSSNQTSIVNITLDPAAGVPTISFVIKGASNASDQLALRYLIAHV